MRGGGHLQPLGSQTPEPTGNPSFHAEASKSSPFPRKKGMAALLADRAATMDGSIDGMASWEVNVYDALLRVCSPGSVGIHGTVGV